MIKIEARYEPSANMIYAAPVIALVLTMLAGVVLFMIMGQKPGAALYTFFIDPVSSWDGIAELLVKATPLTLIGIGLSVGFRANVWNIGAEGQLTMGALAGGAVGLYFYEAKGFYILPLMIFASIVGGIAWAAIPAFFRTKFNANEILTSLMLVYIALLILDYQRWTNGISKDRSLLRNIMKNSKM